MLGRHAAAAVPVLIALLLGGCALISGPCQLDVGEHRASCERGGLLIVLPTAALRAIGEVARPPPDREVDRLRR